MRNYINYRTFWNFFAGFLVCFMLKKADDFPLKMEHNREAKW